MKAIMIVCFLSFCLSMASASTHLTQAQAIQIASDFCQRIGTPVTVDGKARLLVHDDLPTYDYRRHDDHYYQPYWEVEFEGQAKVQVVDTDGSICSYLRKGLSDEQPSGNDISKEKAFHIALNALQATDQTDQLHFDKSSRNSELDTPGGYTDHDWFFDWSRMYNGILFHDQGVRITVHPASGTVSGLSVNYTTPLPHSVDIAVSRAQADAIANALVTHRPQMQNTTLYNIQVRIVQPNNVWQEGMAQQMAVVSRVAYVYTLSDPENAEFEIWIDAQNGHVLGGDIAPELDDEKAPPKLPLRKRLMQAQEVRIYARQRDGKQSQHPIVILNARSQGKMFATLKATQAVKKAGPLALSEYQFVLYARGKPLCALNYMPATGRLGKDYSWGIVPERFKTWIQTLKPHIPDARKPVKVALSKKLVNKS